MAKFTIDIEDAHVQETFDSFASEYGYMPMVPNLVPQGTVTDPATLVVSPDPSWPPLVPNPQSLEAFARQVVIGLIQGVIDRARTKKALAAAQAAAAALPPVIIK